MTYLKKNITYKKNTEGEWVAYYGEQVLATATRKADCEALAKRWVEDMNAAAEPIPDDVFEAEVEAESKLVPMPGIEKLAELKVKVEASEELPENEPEEAATEAEIEADAEEPYNLNHKLEEVLDALKNGEELRIMTADIIFSCRQTDNGMFSITELASGETKVVKFPKFYGIAIRDAFGLPTNKAHVRK